jgi:hypothetical protein
MRDQEIRDLLIETLREHLVAGGGRGLAEQARDKAKRKGWAIDSDFWRALTEHFWTLARAGIIAIMPRDPAVVPGVIPEEERIPTFFITELGKTVLREPTVTPYDWAKYQATVKMKVPAPDDIVIVHLGEAVLAWQSGLYRASAVMLGCAVERLIIMVAVALRDAALPAPADKLDRLLRSRTQISDTYEVVRAVLDGLAQDRKIPGALADVWEQRLTAAFEHTRALRNKSGHPTGAVVTIDDAHSGLLLFPGLYEFVDTLIEALPRPGPPPEAAS